MLPAIILASFLIASPAEDYWQQDVTYYIEVELDTVHHFLNGKERLIYINNSPDTLPELYFHLYPNAYRDRTSLYAQDMERMGKYRFSFSKEKDRGWIEIDSLMVNEKDILERVSLLPDKISEMKISLPEPLFPGDSVILTFHFRVKIPYLFSRLGRMRNHYEITQWYPKPVVYDRKGWHPDGYRAIGEFYGEYGTYDVFITLPDTMEIGATGELVSTTVAGKGKTRYHFRAEKVHDFAFICDPYYKVISEYCSNTLVRVLYFPREEKEWKEALAYAKDALTYYGRWYGEYPYSTLTVAQGFRGAGGGMEYPNIVLISTKPTSLTNFFETVIMHEVGHQWFYGMVGSNEMDEAWLDEGINTFSEIRYLEEKYGKDEKLINLPGFLWFLSPMNDRYLHSFLYHTASQYEELPILSQACDFIDDPASYSAIAYAKAGLVVDMLREYVGKDTFDIIMRTYVERFSYKHPTTEDFIGVVNEVTGEDMTWFFDQWLRTTEKCDYEMTSVSSGHFDVIATSGYGPIYFRRLRIRRLAPIIMPFDLVVTAHYGERMVKHFSGNFSDTVVEIRSAYAIKEVVIDPHRKILEVNRWNNYWPRKKSIKAIFDFPDFDAYQVFYYPYAWYQTVDGIQVGGGLQGRQFIPMDQFHGSNSWDYHAVYGTKSRKFLHGASYSFPVRKTLIARVELGFNQAEERQKVSLTKSVFHGIFSEPEHKFVLSYEHNWLGKYLYKMEKYWERSNLHIVETSYTFQKRSRRFTHYFIPRLTYGTGDFDFTRVSLRISEFIRTNWNNGFTVKLFGGYVGGGPPRQYRFYPSGSLYPTGESPFVLTYEGKFSPLEHWHIEGGSDLKGYYGRDISGTAALSINLATPYLLSRSWFPSTVFFDAGILFDDSSDTGMLYDAGFTVNAGPLYMDFPIWVSSPAADEKHFAFRWSFGISASTVSLF
jgi:hypothetical protein